MLTRNKAKDLAFKAKDLAFKAKDYENALYKFTFDIDIGIGPPRHAYL